jgi:hypothetical protein
MTQTQNDICWVQEGFYLDVMYNYTGTWSCYFNHRLVREGFATRTEAFRWLRSKSIKELVNMI